MRYKIVPLIAKNLFDLSNICISSKILYIGNAGIWWKVPEGLTGCHVIENGLVLSSLCINSDIISFLFSPSIPSVIKKTYSDFDNVKLTSKLKSIYLLQKYLGNCSKKLFYFQKLWYQHVWPCLQQEMRAQEVLAAVLQPILFIIQESTVEDYENIILPSFR